MTKISGQELKAHNCGKYAHRDQWGEDWYICKVCGMNWLRFHKDYRNWLPPNCIHKAIKFI